MKSKSLWILIVAYFAVCLPAATMRLDGDEFTFVREPYELLGGDYTRGYLREGEYVKAISVIARSYYFFWKYRPINAPIIQGADLTLFAEEEERFGYIKPSALVPGQEKTEERYQSRLVVPEPDRFYSHGAGKPLLAPILNIPSLGLVALFSGGGGKALLAAQFSSSYDPIFILVRFSALLCGLLSLVLVYTLARLEWDERRAFFAGAFFLLFPSVPIFFPNIHHDPYMVPFLLGAVLGLVRRRIAWAGFSFGLALAAKNTAILLIPVIGAWLLLTHLRRNQNVASVAAKSTGLALKDVLIFLGVSFITLLPFANPVSYAVEVLTPFTGREFDSRGENVDQFTLRAAASGKSNGASLDSSGEPIGEVRPEVRLLQKLLPWSVHIGFVLIAILACAGRLRGEVFPIAFLFTLMAFPHSLVFGDGLIWRSLVFAPFFALVMAAWVESRARWAVLVLMSLVVAVLVLDPLTARGQASPEPAQRWWNVWG